MELKKDLLIKDRKSVLRIILGVLFVICACGWIFSKEVDSQKISLFDWFYSIVFALNGIYHIFEGIGFRIEKLFGKAFIEINNDIIDIKTGALEKEYKIDWQDIKVIEYKPLNLIIKKLDNSSISLSVSKLDYVTINEIKKIISKLSTDKKIEYVIQ